LALTLIGFSTVAALLGQATLAAVAGTAGVTVASKLAQSLLTRRRPQPARRRR
jgi:hypothetical protein